MSERGLLTEGDSRDEAVRDEIYVSMQILNFMLKQLKPLAYYPPLSY